VTVRRYLIVANQTLGGRNLRRAVRRRIRRGACSFHLLVPAAAPTGPWDAAMAAYEGEVPEGEGSLAEARARLQFELEWLRAAGADVDGEIGDPDPITAVNAVLARQPFDEIILSTLPAGISRWLKADLPHRLARHVNVPVVAIVGPPGAHRRRAPTR
jgi:hypothetical protein